MNKDKILREIWMHRGAEAPDWFKISYEQAAREIEDHSDDEDNPYYHGPTGEHDALPDSGELLDNIGGLFPPEEARKIAFELLVLADLAEGA